MADRGDTGEKPHPGPACKREHWDGVPEYPFFQRALPIPPVEQKAFKVRRPTKR